jgi:hypothetical protein
MKRESEIKSTIATTQKRRNECKEFLSEMIIEDVQKYQNKYYDHSNDHTIDRLLHEKMMRLNSNSCFLLK